MKKLVFYFLMISLIVIVSMMAKLIYAILINTLIIIIILKVRKHIKNATEYPSNYCEHKNVYPHRKGSVVCSRCGEIIDLQ